MSRSPALAPAARALLAVLVVSVAVVGAGRVDAPLTDPDDLLAVADGAATASGQGPDRQPVTAAALVCPGPEQQGLSDVGVAEEAQSVRLHGVAPPEQLLPRLASSPEEGRLLIEPTAGTAGVSVPERGEVASLELTGAEGALVRGSDGLAAGVTAVQTYTSLAGGSRGLGVTPCVEPAQESWLVAGGGQPGRTERLVLLNPGADPVTATVRVLGDDTGAEAAEGVVVPAGGRVVTLVDALAPAVGSPAVQVTSSGGPVAAFLGERWLDGTTDQGAELTAPVSAPATSVVIPGVRRGSGEGAGVLLRVGVPGEEQAVVQVQARTPDGPVPITQEVTLVPAGRSQDIALGDLPPATYALAVSSDVPVVAAALSRSAPGEVTDAATRLRSGGQVGPGGASDLAWAPSTDPVSGLAGTVLPAGPAGPAGTPLEATLHLVAGAAQTVEVAQVSDDGTLTRDEVAVGADSMAAVEVTGARSVWVLPETDDDLHATMTLVGADGGGDLISAVPLRSLPLTRAVTSVLPAQD